VNHRVHSLMRGCLTLKFSASWKTVTDSLLDLPASTAVYSEDMLGSLFSLFSLFGEIGMVSRGTGEQGLGAASIVAILTRGKRSTRIRWGTSVVKLR